MRLRPDSAPLLDLSAHRRPEEYEQSSWPREIAKALILAALGALITVLLFAL